MPPGTRPDSPARRLTRRTPHVLADLLFMVTWRDIAIKYKQSMMGLLWAVLMPGIIVAAGMLVQFGMSQLSGRPFSLDALAAVCVKSLPWAFIVGAIRFATNSLTSNSSLLTKINCPRIVFPVSAVLSALFDMLVATIPLVVVLAYTGIRPAASQLWVIPLLLLIVLFVARAWYRAVSGQPLFPRRQVHRRGVADLRDLLHAGVLSRIHARALARRGCCSTRSRRSSRASRSRWCRVAARTWAGLPTVRSASFVTLVAAWVMFYRLEPTFADNV